jgi:hypothetical protein
MPQGNQLVWVSGWTDVVRMKDTPVVNADFNLAHVDSLSQGRVDNMLPYMTVCCL